MEHRAPSPTETWDEFFGEYYLRAYREDEASVRRLLISPGNMAGPATAATMGAGNGTPSPAAQM